MAKNKCPECGGELIKQEWRMKTRIDPVWICTDPMCRRYIVKSPIVSKVKEKAV